MSVTVVTATGLEARAARRALKGNIFVIEAGIGLSRQRRFGDTAISCGLAGGLRAGVSTGTVLIPRTVRKPDGSMLVCDPQLVESLLYAARTMGIDPVDAPVVTSATLVTGAERAELASQGFSGADMETGLIEANRVACVRVILDTPEHEIHRAWGNPRAAILHPRAWVDLPFLATQGPRCASLAAKVLAAATLRF
jgi:hypothetical protein